MSDNDWYESYQELNNSQKQSFERIVQRLLDAPFLTRHKEDNRRDYYFLQRYEAVFRGYLTMGGWQLQKSESLGSYTLRSEHGRNRISLNMEESILLLLLRLLYEEKSAEIRISDEVVTSIGELQQRYRVLEIKDRPIDKRTLRRLISLLRRFNLADTTGGSATDPETKLVLLPTIALAVEVSSIRQIYDRLITYADDEQTLEAAKRTMANERPEAGTGEEAS